jgi:eukaryotic-like serine/threonine-protein kinase
VPPGQIITQDPRSGSRLSRGSSIEVVTSEGRAIVAIPGVLTLGCKSAQTKLASAGFTGVCPNAQQVYSSTLKDGAVISVFDGTAENPTTAPAGSTLTLILSKGPAPVTGTTTTTVPVTEVAVPNLVGLNSAQTKAAMTAAKLYYVTSGPGSANETWTKVVSSSPAAGTMVPVLSSVKVDVTT